MDDELRQWWLPQVRPAVERDNRWIAPIWRNYPEFWDFDEIWSRYWRHLDDAPMVYWLVIQPIGFIHFRVRKDGVKSIYELAVREQFKRLSVGYTLLTYAGRPVKVRVNGDSVEAASFCEAMGLELVSDMIGRGGRRYGYWQGW